jgi:hypothetical protein
MANEAGSPGNIIYFATGYAVVFEKAVAKNIQGIIYSKSCSNE